jgi:hypothetical protein
MMPKTEALPRHERFQQLYRNLSASTVNKESLGQCYHPDIQFQDPFHQVSGLDVLTQYFAAMYENVSYIHFEFHRSWQQDNTSFIRWTMSYRHPKLYAGKQVIHVEGGSELIWRDDLIIDHRDFFDGGNMLYEHLPVLGWAIRKLKGRML